MIVTCERCQTHFRLEAERVPETGVLVRCSRCKHAFVVKKPDEPPDDETLDTEEDFDWEFDNGSLSSTQSQAEQARGEEEADEPPPAPPPEPDLALESESAEETVDSLLELDDIDTGPDAPQAEAEPEPEPAPELAAAPAPELEASADAEPDDDSDPEPYAEVAAESLAADASDEFDEPDDSADTGLAALGDASETEIDELGSPAEWDIFDAPAPAAVRAPIASRPATTREREPLPVGIERRADGAMGVWLARAAAGAGWAATLGLAALLLASGLRPPTPVEAGAIAVAPGITVEDVDARWVDNVAHGEVYVVSANVHNRTSGPVPVPALELVLRDAANRELGEPIAAGGPRAPEVLREGGREELAHAIPMLLGLRSGEMRRFEAVAWSLPAAAERFELRARREARP